MKKNVIRPAGADFHWPIFETQKRFIELLPERKKIMDSHIGIALSYYYYAIRAGRNRLDLVIISLMIAAEALLVIRNDRIKASLSKRLATLVALDEKERSLISKKSCELYELRSAVIHGAAKKPTFEEARQLFEYIRKAIDKALSLRSMSKQELVKMLDAEN